MNEKDGIRLVKVLEEVGGKASNAALREELGWDESRYSGIKEALIEQGRLVRLPGQGGVVSSAAMDQKLFLSALRELGGAAGNITLRDHIDWGESRYEAAKESLIELEKSNEVRDGEVRSPFARHPFST